MDGLWSGGRGGGILPFYVKFTVFTSLSSITAIFLSFQV